MNKKIITLILLFSVNSFAYVPTIESLLRNGGNKDVGSNTAVGVLNITRVTEDSKSELSENAPRKNAIKVLFGNEDTDRMRFIQLDYRDGIVSDSTMNKVHYQSALSLEKLGVFETNQVEAAVFYALMTSLLTNNSKLFMELFASVDQTIQSNKNLVNKEQQTLLMQYKNYLLKQAREDNQDELINPLKPESIEAKEKVREVMRSTYLVNDGIVKRVREKNKFYWDMNTPFVHARFDGETHRLKKFVLTTAQGKIEVDCYNYILFNGNLEFPEVIYFKDLSGQLYELQMSKIYLIKDAPGAFVKRLNNYKKILNGNPEKGSEIIKPAFLL